MFKMEYNPLATTEPTFQRPAKRPRVLVACLRCKGRRQKCDNLSPACSNCAKAKLTCTFAKNEYPSSYVKALEDRIADLETRLRLSQPLQSLDHFSPRTEGSSAAVTSPEDGNLPSPTSIAPPPNLVNSVGFLSLCAAAEPRYFGVSSGVSLAHMIESAVYEKSRPSTALGLPSEADRPFANSVLKPSLASLPTPEKGSLFIEAYLSNIQPSYPFLSRKRIWEAHKNSKYFETRNSEEAQLEWTMLHLVYAIGSRCLQLIGSPAASGVMPEAHYASALSKIRPNPSIPNVRNIEIILLTAIYAMRSPSGSSIWHLCGLMIRQCVELGMQRHSRGDLVDKCADENKKRLFWSIYHLERRVATVLGRPFAIGDDEIDLQLPIAPEEELGDIFGVELGRFRELPESPATAKPKYISLHVQLILLDQLNSKVRLTISRLAKGEQGAKADAKIAKRFQDLENWRTSALGDLASSKTTGTMRPQLQEHERLALLLGYHRAKRLLLQSILTDKVSSQPFDYNNFARSSGQVCQINRRLHRLKSVPFTLLDLHSVFIAGFSMVYCAWVQPDLYDAELAADFGACSTVLYVIAEQWPSAKKYRDAFELVAEKTAEYVASAARTSRSTSLERVTARKQIEGPEPAQAEVDTTQHAPEWNDYSMTESFDVWQMMNQFVEMQDGPVQYDASFGSIEELLAEEGLGWFSGTPWAQ